MDKDQLTELAERDYQQFILKTGTRNTPNEHATFMAGWLRGAYTRGEMQRKSFHSLTPTK